MVWPQSHEEVVKIVERACGGGGGGRVVLVPFGGGTSVTGGVGVGHLSRETMVVSVDMSQMVNRKLQFNSKSNVVLV